MEVLGSIRISHYYTGEANGAHLYDSDLAVGLDNQVTEKSAFKKPTNDGPISDDALLELAKTVRAFQS